LLGIGIGKYDSNKLAKKLVKKSFWKKAIQKTLYTFGEKNISDDSEKINANHLLYINNVDDQQVTGKIDDELAEYPIDLIVDEAREENYNIIWYAKQIFQSKYKLRNLGGCPVLRFASRHPILY